MKQVERNEKGIISAYVLLIGVIAVILISFALMSFNATSQASAQTNQLATQLASSHTVFCVSPDSDFCVYGESQECVDIPGVDGGWYCKWSDVDEKPEWLEGLLRSAQISNLQNIELEIRPRLGWARAKVTACPAITGIRLPGFTCQTRNSLSAM